MKVVAPYPGPIRPRLLDKPSLDAIVNTVLLVIDLITASP